MTQSNLLDRNQAADYLRVSLRTIDRWRSQRTGPPVTKVGKKIFYRLSSLENWLTSHTHEMPRDHAAASWSTTTPQRSSSRRAERIGRHFTGFTQCLDFFISPRDSQPAVHARRH